MRLSAHPRPPLTRGLDFAKQKTGGEIISLLVSLPPSSPNGESTSLIRGRLAAAAGLGIAKAFWNHQHSWWFSLTNKESAGGKFLLRFLAESLEVYSWIHGIHILLV